ncbi:TetR/AcrR family transcriptional regulator [Shewanella salipaludis]|uniref:TetR/AcrR family transcriptional regulator n=1 Tax=Shewanella salipaludis TaxID=2723052 RepID=A0A972FTA5_9GAMM|nr:TetR/AcrR family transcriptional regulator [Shewanella salipaludis]NMH65823.1 TetR/AcrR family transcriptional regulator [Shewanella salipaludis]
MRNAEFDREQVLRAAMTAFMHKGYTKTSMQDLTQATGLHPGSIYCAFENKRGLLLAAIEQYRLDREAQFAAVFSNGHPVLSNLKSYLDGIVKECISCDAAQACLLTKALNEVAEQDEEVQQILSSHLDSWRQGLAAQLRRAQHNEELAKDKDAEHLARYLVMGIYGLRTYAHTHPAPDTLQQLAEQLYRDVCA